MVNEQQKMKCTSCGLVTRVNSTFTCSKNYLGESGISTKKCNFEVTINPLDYANLFLRKGSFEAQVKNENFYVTHYFEFLKDDDRFMLSYYIGQAYYKNFFTVPEFISFIRPYFGKIKY